MYNKMENQINQTENKNYYYSYRDSVYLVKVVGENHIRLSEVDKDGKPKPATATITVFPRFGEKIPSKIKVNQIIGAKIKKHLYKTKDNDNTWNVKHYIMEEIDILAEDATKFESRTYRFYRDIVAKVIVAKENQLKITEVDGSGKELTMPATLFPRFGEKIPENIKADQIIGFKTNREWYWSPKYNEWKNKHYMLEEIDVLVEDATKFECKTYKFFRDIVAKVIVAKENQLKITEVDGSGKELTMPATLFPRFGEKVPEDVKSDQIVGLKICKEWYVHKQNEQWKTTTRFLGNVDILS